MTNETGQSALRLPSLDRLFYGGGWHAPAAGGSAATINPANGAEIAKVAEADEADVDKVVEAARLGFKAWRQTPPLARAAALRKIAAVLREHVDELALLEATDCGNPIRNVKIDIMAAAAGIEFFAGLVTEMKGDTIPVGPDAINFTAREPRGVVARIVAFNHPLLFAMFKAAAPLAAGNSVIVKPPEQAPLSVLRVAELIGDLLPAGVLNIVPGNRNFAKALVEHSGVAMVGLVGSTVTGRAVLRGAAETIKPVVLELGGKNALIACSDADPARVAQAMITGMNFNWCGQSCGSTSRAFVHDSIYDVVVGELTGLASQFRPGNPVDPATTMGALVSREHYEHVLRYIELGKAEGGRMLCGGAVDDIPELADGYFIRPTIFVDADTTMKIAREEIFGPVLTVLRWQDEKAMIEDVNELEYGLTCSIWTNDFAQAHRLASEVEAGQVWVNDVGHHISGAPFGGYKQSGLGREGGISELLSFTEEKNIYLNLVR